MSVRHTQNYLAELETGDFIRRIPRISKSGQTSNVYVFLWHPLFEEGVQNPAPKESQSEESHSKESHNIDLDSPPTNRKNRDSRVESGDVRADCKKYPRLRETLADYMTTADDGERVYPPERLVVDVMDAAGGASEDEVIECLRYLKDGRGLRPGTKNGPRHFSWFKTVVADYFLQKRNRETVYSPPNVDSNESNGSRLSKEEFDAMTDALEGDGF